MNFTDSDAQRLINIIDQRIEERLRQERPRFGKVAAVDTVPGFCSVYLSGESAYASPYIRYPNYMHPQVNDAVIVVVNPNGERRLVDILRPTNTGSYSAGNLTVGGDLYATAARLSSAVFVDDGQVVKTVTPTGWTHVAPFLLNTQTFTTATNFAAVSGGLGGTVAIPIRLDAPMVADRVRFWSTDTANLRTAECRLYIDTDNTGACAFVTGTDVTFSFTPSAASSREAVYSTPVLLAPGIYWIVFRNTSTSQTFGMGHAGGNAASNVALGNNLSNSQSALGATIDLSGWSAGGAVFGVFLMGTAVGRAFT